MAVASCATSRGVLQSPVLASLGVQQALMDRSALEMGYVESSVLDALPSSISVTELAVVTELADCDV